jgi:hypothetical protein
MDEFTTTIVAHWRKMRDKSQTGELLAYNADTIAILRRNGMGARIDEIEDPSLDLPFQAPLEDEEEGQRKQAAETTPLSPDDRWEKGIDESLGAIINFDPPQAGMEEVHKLAASGATRQIMKRLRESDAPRFARIDEKFRDAMNDLKARGAKDPNENHS